MYSPGFNYRFKITGNTTGIFVEPLLFLPFVKDAINRTNQPATAGNTEFIFIIEEDHIQFRCHTTAAPVARKKNFRRIIQRLEILYPEQFRLNVSGNEQKSESLVELEIQIHHA